MTYVASLDLSAAANWATVVIAAASFITTGVSLWLAAANRRLVQESKRTADAAIRQSELALESLSDARADRRRLAEPVLSVKLQTLELYGGDHAYTLDEMAQQQLINRGPGRARNVRVAITHNRPQVPQPETYISDLLNIAPDSELPFQVHPPRAHEDYWCAVMMQGGDPSQEVQVMIVCEDVLTTCYRFRSTHAAPEKWHAADRPTPPWVDWYKR